MNENDTKTTKVFKLRWKLLIAFISIMVFSNLALTTINSIQVRTVSSNVSQEIYVRKVESEIELLQRLVEREFGELNLNSSGELVGTTGKDIKTTDEVLNKFYEKTGTHAIIFKKVGSEFIGVNCDSASGKANTVGIPMIKDSEQYKSLSANTNYNGIQEFSKHKYITSYKPMLNKQGEIIGAYYTGATGDEIDKIIEAEGGVHRALLVFFLNSLLVLALVIIGVVVSANLICKPINILKDSANKIADGDFDVVVNYKTNSELGQLRDSFNGIAKQLQNYQDYIDEIAEALEAISKGDFTYKLQKDYAGQFEKLKVNMEKTLEVFKSTMGNIDSTANYVASGAEQVSCGAQSLSQGATEQASSIEELSATIENISDKIKRSADTARLMREKSEITKSEVNSSNENMQNMTNAMADIATKSDEISKIIKVIDDIAFQTNILALNAAVEAARAGTAGKGFSVVADEVRNLASKSAEAAKATSNMIEETQIAVANGTQIVNDTAEAMKNVVTSTNEVLGLIEEISNGASEQAEDVTQVSMGVQQISSVVQNNSATAEESAAASEELSSQSKVLTDLVAKFKLE